MVGHRTHSETKAPVTLASATIAAVQAHARECYPYECCGIILRRSAEEAVRRIRNSYDEERQRDPAHFPRTARTAYFMDPTEHLRVEREADQDGWTVAALYHSHPNGKAYFSADDREKALYLEKDEERGVSLETPVYPGATYLIIGLDEERVREMKAFCWDLAAREFLEAPIVAADPA